MNTHTTPDHPSDEQLANWLDSPGDMRPGEIAALVQHLEGCHRCEIRLKQLSMVETGLQALRIINPVPTDQFEARVMSALPTGLYAHPAAAWARGQLVALGFFISGLVALVVSGDALAIAAQWWQDANTWLGNASLDDSTWLGNSPGGALESHLGLLPGAILLGIGALLALVSTLHAAGSSTVSGGTPVHIGS
jgi:hypothetical protein